MSVDVDQWQEGRCLDQAVVLETGTRMLRDGHEMHHHTPATTYPTVAYCCHTSTQEEAKLILCSYNGALQTQSLEPLELDSGHTAILLQSGTEVKFKQSLLAAALYIAIEPNGIHLNQAMPSNNAHGSFNCSASQHLLPRLP